MCRSAWLEVERIGHDDVATAARLGELPALDRLGDAVGDRAVLDRRLLHDRRTDLAGTGDDEVDRHAALEVGVLGQTRVVAGPNLVDVGAHDTADDVLVECTLDLGLGLPDLRDPLTTTTEAG